VQFLDPFINLSLNNVSRGKRKKQAGYVIEDDSYNKSCSKSWARLIKKIYELDPLTCPKCKGSMRIIAFIEDYKVIKKILDWLGIEEFKRDNGLHPKDLLLLAYLMTISVMII